MKNLLESERFSFLYNGKPFREYEKETKIIETQEACTTTYRLPDGLTVTNITRRFDKYGAFEWVTYFENSSERTSCIISELNDCDFSLPFIFDERGTPALMPAPKAARIYNPAGSTWNRSEFACSSEAIYPGETKSFATSGGRSSQQKAPFFDINQNDYGVMFAIGWTGQWSCTVSRDDSDVYIKTGIEDVCFRLYPGEKIRTSSIVVMPYECAQNDAHNRFRRLIKEHFSLIGQEGRDKEGPLCHMFWGALNSDEMIDRIQKINEHKLGFDYIWVDAGWYGYSTGACPNEFEGDWSAHTGSWSINKTYHPDDMKKVSEVIANSGMKFLLWVEPERCRPDTDGPAKHPEWFLKHEQSCDQLLNLGNPEALNYAIELLSDLIKKLNISCYRQDFNMDPLLYWRDNDEPDRRGINEIKHIMGLYTFWDTLLLRFPNLIIDNCASGGRRIDIETLRRSIPLWRSDYQCWWDADPETTQTHSSSISWWLPYSGTGAGNIKGDLYRARSCYAPALSANYWGYEGFPAFNKADAKWVKKINEEYKQVRPFLSCDYYPLILSPLDDSNWSASQFNRPESGEGIILAFRRPKSPCDRAQLYLEGLNPAKHYVFTDADSGECFTREGIELTAPFTVELPETRSSKLIFYREK